MPDIKETWNRHGADVVNGIDVECGEREPDEYQAGTRYYNTHQGWKPFPHARLIANTIIEQQKRMQPKA